MRKKHDNFQLPLETKVELVAIRGDEVFKKIMTYGESLNVQRKKGFKYYTFQLGFSQFNNLN